MSPKSKVRKKEPVKAVPLAARADPERLHRAYRRHRRLVRAGQALMAAGVALALEHVAAHLGAFGAAAPSGTVDLLFGWPMASVIFMAGGVMAGQTLTSGRQK
jgi:hypothetical protein